MWNIPLKFQGLQRVRFFIWLVFKHRLRAKEEMVRSGILHVCGHISEDILHVLKDCIAARNGSVQNDGSFSAAGGITNSHGKWILGYNRYSVVQTIQKKTPKGSNSALVRRIHQLLDALVTSIFVTSLDRETKMRID
ncbi:hypothetical protein Goshw_030383 [Gossypium schwendimanii]|uniref:Reverse transcriptase zinc-binding domain-containing protein n=1 Tax=Gossypium schwendimanii TaxID=34291 RepID=A0A7J9M8W9_GOSSC|nr:hypothetical protein [Gossypium schwendimanii]